MNIKELATKYIVPALGLLVLSALFFYPQLQNKELSQSDITAFKGAAQELIEYRESTGEVAWWTNSMFGGMPAYQIISRQPTNILVYVDKVLQLFISRPIGLFFLVMLCTYVSLILFGSSPWVSFFWRCGCRFEREQFPFV